MSRAKPSLRVLGTRGIPAAHGGFETFAERLGLYLQDKGWDVTVYCQLSGGSGMVQDAWNGIRRVGIPVGLSGPAATMLFDWRSVAHAARFRDPCLVLGYNTAMFLVPLRARRIPVFINMDGVEWRRAKWGAIAKAWLFLNERAGGRIGDFIIADHPEIKEYLSRFIDPERISMIPYGADHITNADATLLERWGVQPERYLLVIARFEPENSIEEIVRAFSAKRRGHKLLVIGPFEPDTNRYHRLLRRVASDEVVFAGALYETAAINALRRFAFMYLHGHRVGGTNPSLVEALGAGCAVLAHDNRFNRWVAGEAARYFTTSAQCEVALDELLEDAGRAAAMRAAAEATFIDRFTWDAILAQYEALLTRATPAY